MEVSEGNIGRENESPSTFIFLITHHLRPGLFTCNNYEPVYLMCICHLGLSSISLIHLLRCILEKTEGVQHKKHHYQNALDHVCLSRIFHLFFGSSGVRPINN
jgi:hypothetical protein